MPEKMDEYIVSIAGGMVIFLAGIVVWGTRKWVSTFEQKVSEILNKLEDIDDRLDGIEVQQKLHQQHMQNLDRSSQDRFSNIEANLSHANEKRCDHTNRIAKLEGEIEKFKIFHKQNHPGDSLD